MNFRSSMVHILSELHSALAELRDTGIVEPSVVPVEVTIQGWCGAEAVPDMRFGVQLDLMSHAAASNATTA